MKKSKLKLERQTVRVLVPARLVRVAGGRPADSDVSLCPGECFVPGSDPGIPVGAPDQDTAGSGNTAANISRNVC